MKSKEIRKFRKTYTKYDKDCVFEGYKLAVLFDEKDDIKRYGGKWDAGAEHWWMPESKLKDEVHDNGTLVEDYLNDNQMIMGQYGKYKGPCKSDSIRYLLQGVCRISTEESRYNIQWFADEDAVSFGKGIKKNGKWMFQKVDWFTVEAARCRWDELISEGYCRVSA